MLARKGNQPPFSTKSFAPCGMALRFALQLFCAAFVLWFLVLTIWNHAASQPGIEYHTRGGTSAPATNSTLGFQKIYAISLPQRTDRQDALTLMSVLSGLEIDIAPGVRGEDVLEKTVPKVYDLVLFLLMCLTKVYCMVCTETPSHQVDPQVGYGWAWLCWQLARTYEYYEEASQTFLHECPG